jgi:acetolactate synthase regulatory subunit
MARSRGTHNQSINTLQDLPSNTMKIEQTNSTMTKQVEMAEGASNTVKSDRDLSIMTNLIEKAHSAANTVTNVQIECASGTQQQEKENSTMTHHVE